LVSSSGKTGNRILDAFPPSVLARLQRHLEPCELTLGKGIHDPGDIAEYVYFTTSGLISVVATMKDGASIEIGVVGREGMFSISTILGDDTPAQRAMVQLPGQGLRLKASFLRQEMAADSAIQAMLLRYAQATLSAVAQSAACNRLHPLEKRCARWLLMAHDRAAGDTFRLTHEFLAMMLGVRRPGVTIAAQSLQSSGLIAYSHGVMTVVDRPGLEATACECYAAVEDEFRRLLPT
jgi:CRP-like cAMP-binding protein